MQSKSKTAWSILVGLLASMSTLHAQNHQVVTSLNGLEYEGEVFDIQEYSAGQTLFSPFGSANPIIVIDDGLRRVMVNFNSVLPDFGQSQRNEIEIRIYQRKYNGTAGNALGQLFAGPFDEFGHRELVIRNQSNNRRSFVQGITKITPRYCIVDSLVGTQNNKQWKMPIATSTINRDTLHKLLLRQIDPDDVNDYFEIVDFFQQAGDFRLANDELLFIEKKFPQQRERIEEQRTRLAQLFGRQILSESKLRLRNGQSRLAALWAKVLDSPEFSLDIQAELEEIKDNAELRQGQLASIGQQIAQLIESTPDLVAQSQLTVNKFSTELQQELSDANASRLDAYLRVANDDSIPNQQKIALAISGWLLGSNQAIENLATVQSLYEVKSLVFEYLASATSIERRKEILRSLKSFETGIPNFIDPLLKQSVPVAQQDLSDYTGRQPIEFFVELPGPPINPRIRRYRCLAHLPAEYDPHRRYPMILTLPGTGQELEQNLNIWCGSYNEALSNELKQPVRNGHAGRHGYIVVAVDWRRSQRETNGYRYSIREHRIVLEGLYESLRRFSIDSDRVFLSGHGEGGTAAYDIGVSHPEHWAGVLGFSGFFKKYVDRYNGNRHVGLPVYAVVGEKHVSASRSLEKSANKWLKSKLNRFINLTIVQYKGQLNRFFEEEIPLAFNWINAQNRKWPDGQGFSFECKSLREGDTYFWFFELDGLPPKMYYSPELFDQTKFKSVLKMAGSIKRPNTFLLEPRNTQLGVGATLWLGPDFVDFNQRVEIKGRGSFKGDVTPSTETLLNDVLRRGDTRHPYWARLKCLQGRDWSQVD